MGRAGGWQRSWGVESEAAALAFDDDIVRSAVPRRAPRRLTLPVCACAQGAAAQVWSPEQVEAFYLARLRDPTRFSLDALVKLRRQLEGSRRRTSPPARPLVLTRRHRGSGRIRRIQQRRCALRSGRALPDVPQACLARRSWST
jgi:hypothetical protein